MSKEYELFKGQSFSDLMQDIYHNSKKKERQINTLIQELQPMIKNIGDATVIVPLIKEYLDVAVRNDDALVKLASVVQRLISSENKVSGETEFGLSDIERQQLLDVAEQQLIDIQTQMETESADSASN